MLRRALLIAAGLAVFSPALAAVQPAAQTSASATATSSVEEIGGTLADGTRWIARKPANWNGALLLDLDGAGFAAMRPPPGLSATSLPAAPPTPTNAYAAWLLSQGYAMGGVTREPVGYDFPKAVDYLLDVRGRFIAKWGQPKRTLAVGGSRGAFVVRKALELHPEVFDGGMLSAGGGAGEIAVLRNKLNALFVLKTLAEGGAALKLVNIDATAEADAVKAIVAKARATPAGRARLALSAAVEQFPRWSSVGSAKPAPDDYETQLDQMADNYVFAIATPVRAGVEKVAGGNVSWNTDADYADLLKRSGRLPMVEALYRKAGLSLSADLAALAKAPRISADPAAIARAEPLMTYTGKIKGPLVNVDNDDPVDPASDKLVYLQTLKKAGADGLFRLIWADGPGHGGQTNLDRATGFTLLIERMDTGRWPDTSLPALRARAAKIAAASPVDLGKSTLFDPGPLPPASNSWDATNWGRYRR
jgi:pimeloyl-ACP methyl ester carboxylesterase